MLYTFHLYNLYVNYISIKLGKKRKKYKKQVEEPCHYQRMKVICCMLRLTRDYIQVIAESRCSQSCEPGVFHFVIATMGLANGKDQDHGITSKRS